MKKLFGLLMVLAMAGAFMSISVEQTIGEPIAAISHEIEVAGSGMVCAEKKWKRKLIPGGTECSSGGTQTCPCHF